MFLTNLYLKFRQFFSAEIVLEDLKITCTDVFGKILFVDVFHFFEQSLVRNVCQMLADYLEKLYLAVLDDVVGTNSFLRERLVFAFMHIYIY